MADLLENADKVRTRLTRKVRLGLILSLLVLAFVLVLVAGGPTMPIVALGLIASAILFLATNPRKAIFGLIVIAIFYIALSLRVYGPYDSVFMGDWVKFGGNDPWFYMRLADNLAQTFPHRILFDPYALYPGGSTIGIPPFFLMLLGSTTWVIGLGSPSEYIVETVGAYFPAILGAMVTIPVYFIGKEIFNRNVGLLCAALIAILPGEFLFRSLLGFTDHHIAEVLFSTTAALFLIMAIKRAKEKETSFSHIRSRDWGRLRKPLIYALLAGLALGIYLLSWIGALLFVLIIFAYLIIQYIIDHLRGKSTDYICIIGVPLFLIALIMVIPYSDFANLGKLGIPSLTIAVLALLVLSGVSQLMSRRNIKRAYYPLALACFALAGVGILYAIDPDMFRSMLNTFEKVFIPSATKGTIMEARPIFSDFDITNLTEHRVWYYFTTGLFIFPVALILLIYATVKGQNSEKTFLIVWCLIMLAATLGQVRFAYYFAVNVALLTGYFCWKIPGWIAWIFERIGFRETSPDDKKRKKGRASERGEPTGFLYLKPRYISRALAAIIVFFLAFYPNIGEAINTAENPWGPNDAWRSSLVWMRENTPDPFEDPDFYYALYEKPPAGEEYAYPESAYGVMSWWDYGYWITRIAHRIPNASPSGQANAREAAEFFTAQDESSANDILDEMGSHYVILDYEMSTSKFHVMPTWAGGNTSDFYELCYPEADGTVKCYKESDPNRTPIYQLYYPPYYQSMCARLYNFGGQKEIPGNSTWAMSYAEGVDGSGNEYKVITGVANEGQSFATYDEAEAFLDDHPDYILVGLNPFASCIPLDGLENYEPKYESQTIEIRGYRIPYVKIFQYSP